MAGLALAVAGPAFSQCKLDKVSELPVTMRGITPLVSAKINGAPVTLMADSGAFFSILTPEAADRLGLKGGPLPFGMTVIGATGAAQMTFTTAKAFTAPGMNYTSGVDFLVGDTGLETVADGLLGANFLSAMDTEYDFAHGVIRLMHPENCGKADLAYWAHNVAVGVVTIDPLDGASNHIKGTATVNGVPIRVMFDTGAGRSVISLAAAKRAGVTPQDAGVISAGKAGGVGRAVINEWIAPFKSFEVGGEAIRNTKLRISDIDMDNTDMLLGADFFRSHHVYVARSQNKLYFTYNGGPVFDLEAAPKQTASAAADDTPTDAAGYARRAAVLLPRDVKAAMADYNKAVEMAPTNATILYERALAESETGQLDLALPDYDKALSLNPNYTAALLARGSARLKHKDLDGAREDFSRVAKADPDLRLQVGRAYADNDMLSDAIDIYGQIIAKPANRVLSGPSVGSYVSAKADDIHVSDALAGRCHARALIGQDLKAALDDCNRGIRLSPGQTSVVVDRAYVRLRLGQFDEALADYATALKDQPKNAWALYGRGLAELRKGSKDAGEADIKLAETIEPEVAKRGQTYGLTP